MNPLIEKLLQPERYHPPVANVELLETHISWVLLAGDYAYKIKKPVNFGFLDYSTLPLRRQACLDELRLNRRFAAELYLDVVAIGGTRDAPQWGGDGETIEYAVKMRRFRQRQLYARMLADGRLLGEHIDQLADCVATFHQTASRSSDADAHGLPEAIQAAVRENIQHILAALPQPVDPSELAAIAAWGEEQFRQLQTVMLARKAGGWVRECHGDLHLGNIVWQDGHALPFDSIEFNENLRWVDVISEIAFAVMDLQVRGRSDLAYRLLNRYLRNTGDFLGCRLLRYYLAYRGMVRAKIALLSHAQSANPRQQHELFDTYRRQLAFVKSCIDSPAPLLVVCHGFSGSGKSTLAMQLAEQLPAIVLQSDVERKRLCGHAPQAGTGSQVGQGIYTSFLTEQTYRHLAAMVAELLAAGHAVLVDATCLQRWQRDLLRGVAAASSVPYCLLSVGADIGLLRQRIRSRAEDPAALSEATQAVLDKQLACHEPLATDELPWALLVSGGHSDCTDLVQKVRAALAERSRSQHFASAPLSERLD